MIFLSDGECSISDRDIQNLCQSAVRLGYVTSFLRNSASTSLTLLLEETHYLSIPSPLAQMLPPLPSVEWPIRRSKSRIRLLTILERRRQLFPLFLLLSTQ